MLPIVIVLPMAEKRILSDVKLPTAVASNVLLIVEAEDVPTVKLFAVIFKLDKLPLLLGAIATELPIIEPLFR